MEVVALVSVFPGLVPLLEPFCWSLHIHHVNAWAFCEYSGFL